MFNIILSRLIRYLPHGFFHLKKLPYLAPYLLYEYCYQAVKIYALFTLKNVSPLI